MFHHLLVPLDGSTLAEAVLPAVGAIALKSGARVTLLHVLEQHAAGTIHGQRHLTARTEAEAYLRDTAARALPAGVATSWHVHEREVRDVAESVAAHVAELTPDLVVMCAHAEGQLRDWWFGNLPQQVVDLGSVPVLLVRPTDGACATFRRILLPLDMKPEHEGGIGPAAALAGLFGATLQILVVVPTLSALAGPQAVTGSLLPGATRALLDLAETEASAYAGRLMERLQSEGCTVSATVCRGKPLAAVAEFAAANQTDLIAVGTHGKSGTHAFWEGSMAQRLLRRIPVSFLLAPVASGTDV